MTITYVNDLRLSEMATGDNSGTWGNVTNTNLELIGDALGYGTEAITTNADTHSSTIADGTADAARAMYIKYTGTLDSACTITIGPNTISRVHIIENATSGSQNIIIKQGSGATVTIGSGAVKMVYLDGAGSGAAVTDALVDLDLTGTTTIAALTVSGAITGTTATFTTTDNSTNLSLVCTDTDANVGPVLDLNRNVTGADDDNLGSITFTAKDDAGNAQTYAKIDTSIRDASNSSEASRLNFHVANNGSVTKFLGFIGQTASAGAEITFNEDSNDIDFRVESNGNVNMINVDAGNDRVGIGMIPDTTALTVNGQIGTTNGSASAPTHSFYSDADTGMFRTAANTIGFATSGTERVQIGSFGVAADTLTNKTASGGITIDAAGAIELDSDTGVIDFDDNTLNFGRIENSSSDFKIEARVQDKDIIFAGNDGGSGINALTLDMSNLGFATFNSSATFNETSNDVDFRIEGANFANVFFVDANIDDIGIRTSTPSSSAAVSVFGEGSANYNGISIRNTDSDNTNKGGVAILGSQKASANDLWTGVGFWDDGTNRLLTYGGGGWGNQEATKHAFYAGTYDQGSGNADEIFTVQAFSGGANIVVVNETSQETDFRVEGDGNANLIFADASANTVSIGKLGVATSTAGTDLYGYGLAVFVRDDGLVGLFNRLTSDGDLVSFRQASTEEGTISVSSNTVSYNGFSGLHESSGIASNIPVGTVCSTIDELDVYPDTQSDGKGGIEENPKKGQTRADHAKIKVSDTEGDKRVYGVLQKYNNHGKPLVTSVGIGSIRVTGACEGGDLLESNGDGTAKVQSDDIIRSKTIGKVTIGNSDTGVKLVSCVLYCG